MVLSLADAAFVTTPTNALWNRAGAYPTLDLRFSENKSLVDAVSGQNLVTFTRSGDGTFVGSDGLLKTAATNEPRFDHNPTTGECLGLLVEEQRTNLLLRSEEFDDVAWTVKGNIAVTSNSSGTLSPSGATNAELIVADTASGQHRIAQTIATSAQPYTISVYAKPSGYNWIVLYANAGNSGRHFNIQNGTIGQQTGNANTASIQAVGNGWFRCSMTYTATTASDLIIFNVADADGNFSFAGNSSSGIYLWGAQLEAGAFPTSYIPTTGSAATQNADVADIINTAIANGIRTLYAEFRSPASGTRGVVSLNDNTANERAAINTSGTDPRLVVVDGGVTQADIDAGTIAANVRSRMAVRIAADNFAASFNGGAVVTDTSGTLPTVDRLFIGRTQAGEYLNAPIARLVGWREELPNSALQALTQ